MNEMMHLESVATSVKTSDSLLCESKSAEKWSSNRVRRTARSSKRIKTNSFATVLHTLTNQPDNENNFGLVRTRLLKLNGWYCKEKMYDPSIFWGGQNSLWKELRSMTLRLSASN